MTNDQKIARFPNLPSWEKLLAKLSVLPESENDRKTLRLELIGLLASRNLDSNQALFKVCTFLPKITSCEGIVILRLKSKPLEASIISTNLSDKKANQYLTHRGIIRNFQSSSNIFNRKLSGEYKINKKQMRNYHLLEIFREEIYSIVLMLVSSNPLTSEATKTLEVVQDVFRNKAENEKLKIDLQFQTEKFANITQQLGEGMVMLDQNLKIVLWNKSIQRLTGYKTEEAIGRKIEATLVRSGNKEWFNNVLTDQNASPDRHLNTDFELITKSGEKKWVSCLTNIYRDRSGNLEQVVIIIRDISHSKTLEQNKNEFISIATHELRTPLTAIKGYLSLLERRSENFTPKQLDYLNQTNKATGRLVLLAEDLLHVVQIEQNRILFQAESVQLSSMMKKIVRDFKPKAVSKGLTLSLSYPKELKPIKLDPERTEQIFSNLIDNAIKYTPKGSVKISIDSETKNDRQTSLSVTVKDTGIGINSKKIDEVFEKFHRAHRPEQAKEHGAGLGLYIVKSFVEKQKGSISVRSREGKGTMFIVTFPIANNK